MNDRAREEKGAAEDVEKEPAASLSLDVVCEYMKLPVVRSEATVMARVKVNASLRDALSLSTAHVEYCVHTPLSFTYHDKHMP